jgi:hypothetical protein
MPACRQEMSCMLWECAGAPAESAVGVSLVVLCGEPEKAARANLGRLVMPLAALKMRASIGRGGTAERTRRGWRWETTMRRGSQWRRRA